MQQDWNILRELAAHYAEAAAHPANEERRRLHRAVNDLQPIRPVVLLDEIPWSELAEEESLQNQCTNPLLRQTETYLRRKLYQWQHFPGDMVLQPFLPVEKIIHTTGIGLAIDEKTLRTKAENNIVSHAYQDQLEEESDLEKLHNQLITYDADATRQKADTLQEALGSSLPVHITGRQLFATTADDLAQYHGIENLLIDLMDRPEFIHAAMEKLTGIFLDTVRQYEELNLFEPHPETVHCTTALNSTLPPAEYDPMHVKAADVWGRGAAQIFATVGSQMHHDFDIQYMKQAMEPFGLVYYGCCEPLHEKIDIVEQLPHLRKISITPWANVDMAAERIGKRYVVASKPNPANVAVPQLDENLLRNELSHILSAMKRHNCACDMVLKDISTICFNPRNLERWEHIAMEMVQSI